jgi:cytochrome P450
VLSVTELETPLAYPFPPGPSLYHPSPVFDRLRGERPVTQVTTPDGKTAWLVTRYEDVRRVLTDQRFSRAAAARSDVPLTGLGRLSGESLLAMDPPAHTRQRRLIARAFTVRRVEALRPRVAGLVDELLLALRSQPRPADLMRHFSLPLPMQVIGELLGVPAGDRHVLHEWSDTVMGDWHSDPGELDRALESFSGYFTDLFAGKRAAPADDLISALLATSDEQDALSEPEILNLCVGLFIAGHETTVAQLNMFLLALLHHPDQLDRLRADPALIPHAVDELLRFVQISPGGGTLPRVTTEPVELGGTGLPAGAAVMTATNAANRDPDPFTEPDRLDVCRTNTSHLTFGAGPHHCLGAPLARMQLQEALRGLLRHLPAVRVAVPDSQLRFKRGMTIRNLEALPVSW